MPSVCDPANRLLAVPREMPAMDSASEDEELVLDGLFILGWRVFVLA
jgi:hypothetical protein